MRAFVAMLLVFQVGAAPAADTLGRLFFTPEQRAQLDKLRKQRPQASAAETEKPVEEAPAPALVTYSGVVRKAGAPATIWINNRPVYEQARQARGEPRARLHEDGSATVTVPQQGTVKLKVGQMAEIGSGRVAENYARGPTEPPAVETPPPPAVDPVLRLRRRFADERRLAPDGGPP